jgi:endo-alpha-1,4-polygalactosaminidase (GH114 family)
MKFFFTAIIVVAPLFAFFHNGGQAEAVQYAGFIPTRTNIVRGSESTNSIVLLESDELTGSSNDQATQIDFASPTNGKFSGEFIFLPVNVDPATVSAIRFQANVKVPSSSDQKWRFHIRNFKRNKWELLTKSRKKTAVNEWGMWQKWKQTRSNTKDFSDYISSNETITIRLVSNNDFDNIGIDYMKLRLTMDDDPSPPPSPSPRPAGDDDPSPTPSPSPRPAGGIAIGNSFTYDLLGTQPSYDKEVIFIDLFDTSEEKITSIKDEGRVVICYFSAGTAEDWRDDYETFPSVVIGKKMADWDREEWLDVKSEAVRKIMALRIQTAKTKGCDGVEPDNVDGFANKTGFALKEEDTKNFLLFLASQAHEHELLIGLKNSAEIAADMEQHFDFAVVESCWKYDECCKYLAFGSNLKPVFAIEYNVKNSNTKQNICTTFEAKGFSTMFGNYSLKKKEYCPDARVRRTSGSSISEHESSRELGGFCD